MATICGSRDSVVTPSALDGEPFVRVSIGATLTRAEHVDRLRDLLDALG